MRGPQSSLLFWAAVPMHTTGGNNNSPSSFPVGGTPARRCFMPWPSRQGSNSSSVPIPSSCKRQFFMLAAGKCTVSLASTYIIISADSQKPPFSFSPLPPPQIALWSHSAPSLSPSLAFCCIENLSSFSLFPPSFLPSRRCEGRRVERGKRARVHITLAGKMT